MTEPSNLRDAAEVLGDILRADTAQDAATIIKADRAAVEAATVAKIVAWLRDQGGYAYDDVWANCIEAGEHLK
jgi:predicted N-acetyltransferase YhbS